MFVFLLSDKEYSLLFVMHNVPLLVRDYNRLLSLPAAGVVSQVSILARPKREWEGSEMTEGPIVNSLLVKMLSSKGQFARLS